MVLSELGGRARRAGPPRGERTIKKTLRNIIVFAVIVLALYLLLPRLVDTQETLQYISRASYVLLAVAVLLEIAALAGYANLFRYILRVLDIRMLLRDVWAITLSSLAVSHILSAGGVGGWVVTYNSLMKRKVPHGIIFVAIAAQQFFNYVVLWFFFAVAIVYLILSRGSDSILGYLVRDRAHRPHPVAHPDGVVLVQPADTPAPARHASRPPGQPCLAAEVVKENHSTGWIDNLLIGMRRMVRHRGSFRTTLVLACAFWFFDALCLWCTFQAFEATPSAWAICSSPMWWPTPSGRWPPRPAWAGSGVEGLLIALFLSFGVPSAVTVAVVLV